MLLRRLAPLFVGVFVLSLDVFSKMCTHAYLPLMEPHWEYPYGGIGIFHNFLGIQFSITHQVNKGAAWGILAQYQMPLLYLRLFLIALLSLYILFFNRHPSLRIPLALIIAGAIGNVIDTFLYGHVIDMFHFILWGYDFPVFNVADSAIFLGIASMTCLSLINQEDRAVPTR